jgi:hypothetical protein
VLFGELYDQYNQISIPIQEPYAFHHDVNEISHTAKTLREFYTLILGRREQ